MEEYYYSDLSGKIIVIFYDIYNNVGWGYRENFYERLARTRLYENGIKYKDQFTFPLLYNKTVVKLDRPDLLIEDKIIVELKVGKRFFGKDFAQINEYLKALNLFDSLFPCHLLEHLKMK